MNLLYQTENYFKQSFFVVSIFFVLILVFLNGHNLKSSFLINHGFLKLSTALLSDVNLQSSLLETKHTFESLTQTSPEIKSGWRGLGFTFLLEGQTDISLKIWKDNGVSFEQQLLALGNYYLYYKNDPKKAIKWFEYLVKEDPSSDAAWFALGDSWKTEGKNGRALDAYRTAWRFNPADVTNTLAQFLRYQGNTSEAINIWGSAIEKFPRHPQRLNWWQGLANAHRFQKNWGSARQTAQNGLREFPDDPKLNIELGAAIYNDGGDVNDALRYLQNAIDLNPTSAPAYAEIGYIMAREGLYEEAIREYSQAISYGSNNRSWYLARANVVRGSGNLLRSIELYLEMVDLFPNFDAAYYQLAWAYYHNNQYPEAVTAIEKALSLNQSPPSDYYTRAGLIYEMAHCPEKAKGSYRHALILDPENQLAKNHLELLITGEK